MLVVDLTRPDLSSWGYGDRCFLVTLCHLIVRKPNLEGVTSPWGFSKRLLHQQVKILGQFKCLDHTWKCIFTAISGGVDISEVPGCHYNRWVLTVGQKNYFRDWCLMNSQATFLFLTYVNSMKYAHIVKNM